MSRKTNQKKDNKYPDIPEVPEEIKVAIETGNLYLFVGAGVSRLYGYPSWQQLGANLVDRCVGKKKISNSDREVLLHDEFSAMQVVTIACKLLGDEEAKVAFEEELSSQICAKKENREKRNKMADLLGKFQSPIITTNADLSLDKSSTFKELKKVYNFKKWDRKIDFNHIYHLHGSINDFGGMIFRSQDYAEAYSVESDFGNNLKTLLNDEAQTILFIGYGVNEFELIRYFLKTGKAGRRNLFMLQGYFGKDRIRREFEIDYYASLNITLLPFSIEEKGYDALFAVLEEWAKVIDRDTFASNSVFKAIRTAAQMPPEESAVREMKRFLRSGH